MPARGPAAFVRCGAQRAGPAFVRRWPGPGPGGGGRGGRGRGGAFCLRRVRVTLGRRPLVSAGARSPGPWQVEARGPHPGLPALGPRAWPDGGPEAPAAQRSGPAARPTLPHSPEGRFKISAFKRCCWSRVWAEGAGPGAALVFSRSRRCRDVSGHRFDMRGETWSHWDVNHS